MITGRDIICFSTDWGGHVDSSHHILRRLMAANRVLWVNSTGLRAPKPSLYDLKRAWRKVFRRHKVSSDVPPGPAGIYAPRVIPFFGSRICNARNRAMMSKDIAGKALQLGLREPIIWATLPTAALALPLQGQALVVYYVMDDFTLFPGVNTKAIAHLERQLFEMSDVIFVTADHLKQVKSACGKPITVLPHGVEFDHFHGPRPDPPPEMTSIPKPIVGFFGLVAPWIDVGMMATVARMNPGLSFVFVGDVQTDVSALRALPNVRLLPKVPYRLLPQYARQFDAATMPFVVDDMTVNVNPLKMMEYFALGVPVVSTRLPAAEQHQPHVRIADTAAEFSVAIRQSLTNDTGDARAARTEIARRNSWDSCVEKVSSVIEEALQRKRSR